MFLIYSVSFHELILGLYSYPSVVYLLLLLQPHAYKHHCESIYVGKVKISRPSLQPRCKAFFGCSHGHQCNSSLLMSIEPWAATKKALH